MPSGATIGERVAAATGGPSWESIRLTAARDVSIGAAIETYTGRSLDRAAPWTAALIITSASRRSLSGRSDYSGLMVPVMEDNITGASWAEGAFNTDNCRVLCRFGTGLDNGAFPRDNHYEQMARIFGDVASSPGMEEAAFARLQPSQAGKPAIGRSQQPAFYSTRRCTRFPDLRAI